MKKTLLTLTALLAVPAVHALVSPHVIQGMRVGDNKYKIISITNMHCAEAQKQTLPYEPRSEVNALVCQWRSDVNGGKAFIVLNTVPPELLTVKFYAPGVRVGEITASYPAAVSYDKLRAEFEARPFSEVKPSKGQFGEAYWIDGELLTRLSCAKTGCTVTSGSHYGKAKMMTDGRREVEKAARKADQAVAEKKASAAK